MTHEIRINSMDCTKVNLLVSVSHHRCGIISDVTTREGWRMDAHSFPVQFFVTSCESTII